MGYASAGNNPLYTNSLLTYGLDDSGQGSSAVGQGPAKAQRCGAAQAPAAAQQQQPARAYGFGGSSSFQPAFAQGLAQGLGQGLAEGLGQPALGGQGALGAPALGAPAAGGAAAAAANGGLSPQVMQSLQGLVTALTQVVQQLGSLIQSMGGGQAAGGAAGAAGNAGGGLGGAAGNAGNAGAAGAAGNAGNAGGAQGAAGNAGAGGGYGGAAGGAGGDGAIGGGGYGGGQPGQAAQGIDPNINYQSLSTQQRDQMSGMTEQQRAVLHLWGIQMGSSGHQDGGVYLNVLQNPQMFKPAEVAAAKQLAAQDMAQYGGYTGKALDNAFFGVYQQLTGKDISQRYANAPINFAQGPVNMANRQTGQNGLTNFDNEVMQLWGHSPLFTGGKIDGSILQYSLNSPNALEANLNKGDLQALEQMDMASDGVLNGDSLEKNFVQVLDRMYLGGPDASIQGGMNAALQEASARRDGLLPPPAPEAQGISPQAMQAMNAAIKSGKGASACPFLNGGGAALQGAGGAGN